jgi:autotransporter passenger strand-loop-strand repeat protein
VSGGRASGALVNSGIDVINGVASGTAVEDVGYDYVESGGTAVATTVAGGHEYVETNASTSGTIVDGGVESIFGVASGTTDNSGGEAPRAARRSTAAAASMWRLTVSQVGRPLAEGRWR